MMFSLVMAQSQSGFSAEDVRTVLLTLTTAGILGLLGLVWRMRDNVRDLVNQVGTSDKKGTMLHRLDGLESRVDQVEDRNRGIDLVMRQYVRDMRNIAHGGGQRASDRALQDAVESAFSDPATNEPNHGE